MKPTACLAVLLLACISEVAIAATAVDLDARAETLFSAYAKPGSPGVALLVLEDGRPVLDKAWGQASLEHGVPFTRDTVVRLPYSEAREFLATAAVLMEKDGLVDLDAPLRERFPELPAWAAEVDAWDLLNHRSGFVDEWATLLLMHDSMANHFSEAQFLQLLSRQPRPEVPPGEGYLYSNSDMGLLKLLLQRAAGKPLREWMAERMFGPLGMTATQLDDDPAAVIPRKAQSYSLAPGGYQRAAPDKTSPGGNYYIASSARDLACWANALADPGSDAAWANALLRQRVRTIPPKQEQHRIFGQTELEIAGELVVLHQGVNGFTWLARVPKHRLAVVATTNGSGVATQLRALVDAVVGAVEEAKPRPVFKSTPVWMSLALLDRYAGEYEWQAQERWQSERPVRGRRAQITTTADGLRFDVAGQQVQAVPVGDDLFYARFGGTGVQFRFQPLPDDGMALAKERDIPAFFQLRTATGFTEAISPAFAQLAENQPP